MKNRTKRSAVAMIATLSVAALLLVSLTLAYLTDSRSTLNVLGIGTGNGGGGEDRNTVQIALVEEKFAAELEATGTPTLNGITGEYDKVVMENIVPGQTINKDSTVVNVGADAVYLRVRLTDDQNNQITATNELFTVLGLEVSDQFTYNAADGYYYYTGSTSTHAKLAVDASVEVFVNHGTAAAPYTMKLDPSLNNETLEDLIGWVNLNVVAEAVQSKAFTPGDITSATPWADEDGNAFDIIPAKRG